MKKIILYILALVFLGSFCFSTTTIASSQDALHLWMNTLVPSFLFPLILVRLLAPYHLLIPFLKPFQKIIWNVFQMDLTSFELVLTSLFLGFPSASLFLEDFISEESISQKKYNRFLYCTFLASPNFMLISLRTIYPQDIVVKILLIQLLCIFTLLIFTRRTPLTLKYKATAISFFEQLSSSIQRSFEILFIILAYLLIVYVIIDIVTIPLWESAKIPLKLLSEFSSGCFFINTLSFSLSTKIYFTSLLLSYGGLCVHMQIISSLSRQYFHYFTFLKYRIAHILLSLLFTYLLLM